MSDQPASMDTGGGMPPAAHASSLPPTAAAAAASSPMVLDDASWPSLQHHRQEAAAAASKKGVVKLGDSDPEEYTYAAQSEHPSAPPSFAASAAAPNSHLTPPTSSGHSQWDSTAAQALRASIVRGGPARPATREEADQQLKKGLREATDRMMSLTMKNLALHQINEVMKGALARSQAADDDGDSDTEIAKLKQRHKKDLLHMQAALSVSEKSANFFEDEETKQPPPPLQPNASSSTRDNDAERKQWEKKERKLKEALEEERQKNRDARKTIAGLQQTNQELEGIPNPQDPVVMLALEKMINGFEDKHTKKGRDARRVKLNKAIGEMAACVENYKESRERLVFARLVAMALKQQVQLDEQATVDDHHSDRRELEEKKRKKREKKEEQRLKAAEKEGKATARGAAAAAMASPQSDLFAQMAQSYGASSLLTPSPSRLAIMQAHPAAAAASSLPATPSSAPRLRPSHSEKAHSPEKFVDDEAEEGSDESLTGSE